MNSATPYPWRMSTDPWQMSTGGRPAFVECLRAPNPGPMTLDGTNTWILRGPAATASAVIDPGPDDQDHIDEIVASGPVEMIFVTHRHLDHVGGLDMLATKVDAAVRAIDPALCRGAEPLRDGEIISCAGLRFEVIATPGHTNDSMCLLAFADGEDGGERAIFTGDTILGRGTTVVAWPDGDLGKYLSSLVRLGTLTGVHVLPGHGPDIADCAAMSSAYLAHRQDRLDQVRAAVAQGWHTPADVVASVYPDLEPALVPAAESQVRAALAYLDSA
jgi:glyoxylase-like metal-dependent hydrolase (beta-lactamase superfamily II)